MPQRRELQFAGGVKSRPFSVGSRPSEAINGIFERLKQGAIDGRIDDADGLDKSVWTSQATVNAVNC